jgi:triacylglycerol lipase
MPRKPILPRDFGWLTPPNDKEHPPEYRFFEYEANHRFDPRATDYHPVNAAWLADASLLAYSRPSVVDGAFKLAGGMTSHLIEAGATQCYVAYDDQKVVVAFRGTEVPKPQGQQLGELHRRDFFPDWMTDAEVDVVVDGARGGIHRGFHEAFERAWAVGHPSLQSELEQLVRGGQRTVWFTGHSLGGALATIAASRFGAPCALYTYGSPRVGDGAFRDAFAVQQAYRVVHRHDIVPTVPHIACYPPFLRVPESFVHVGRRVEIDEGNEREPVGFREAPDPEGLREDNRLVGLVADLGRRLWREMRSASIHDRLADHAPTYYASLLWNALLPPD